MDTPTLLFRSKSKASGDYIAIYSANSKFLVRCEAHGTTITLASKTLSRSAANVSFNWCAGCGELARQRKKRLQEEEQRSVRAFDCCLNCSTGFMYEHNVEKRVVYKHANRTIFIEVLKCSKCGELVIPKYSLQKERAVLGALKSQVDNEDENT